MKKLSDTVVIFAVASVLAGIPAIVEAVQPGGTDRVGNVDAWTSNFFSRVPENEPYVIYDDHAHEVWSKLNQIDFLSIEHVNRFYGQDIIITFGSNIVDGGEAQADAPQKYSCATPDPTLFWELVLIRPKGDSVTCELNNKLD